MQVYCIKIKTFLDNTERLLIIDDENNNKEGARISLINNIVQGLQRKHKCDVFVEDFNLVGEAVKISELRKEGFVDE